jgi:hypothetical protein
LPDVWIDLLASKALSIRNVEDLRNLSRKFPLGQYTAIGDGLQQVLAIIQDTVSKADAPQYAIRISGAAYPVPPEKPLYDAGQIMVAPSTIAKRMKRQMMSCEKWILRHGPRRRRAGRNVPRAYGNRSLRGRQHGPATARAKVDRSALKA